VFELEVATELYRPKTKTLNHLRFTKSHVSIYGDILLSGQMSFFDLPGLIMKKEIKQRDLTCCT